MCVEETYGPHGGLRWRIRLVGAYAGPSPPKSCDSQCYPEVGAWSVLLAALTRNFATLRILPCTSPARACLVSCSSKYSRLHDVDCNLPSNLHPCLCCYLPRDYRDCFLKDMRDVTTGDYFQIHLPPRLSVCQRNSGCEDLATALCSFHPPADHVARPSSCRIYPASQSILLAPH